MGRCFWRGYEKGRVLGGRCGVTATLIASSRVALASLMHDLGKFAERARIEVDRERLETWKQLDCPHWDGRPTHIHAAYTTAGFMAIEGLLPPRELLMAEPFAQPEERDADDSLINAAARHHRPDTCLQWIIATADRLASGFERKTFDAYNAAPDDEQKKLNHYTTRQWTLLEDIRRDARTQTPPAWRYPLKAFAPESIFPERASSCEMGDKASAQREYRALWDAFRDGLEAIPASHRASLPLWLDHFESLWLTYTHAIPSATAGIGVAVRPDVSLYDHSKTTAALAVALWRYHADQGHDPSATRNALRLQWDRERTATPEAAAVWDAPKFLLIQGDFFGVQKFIFAEGDRTQRHAAKLLRGRSFYVSLLSELAALKVLEALELPATSQVVNAAGKFLIVAPNAPEVVIALKIVQADLDSWFLEHTWGECGIGLAWLPVAAHDFRQADGGAPPFRAVMKRLFEQLEEIKLRRFDLCGEAAPSSVFRDFLDRFTHGECQIDGRSPAALEKDDVWMSAMAADQIDIGHRLATCDRVLITRTSLNHNSLSLPIFGYHIQFTGHEEATGRFGAEAASGNLMRAWDFSLPESPELGTRPLWKGYARRHINAYVARFGAVNDRDVDRYAGLEDAEGAKWRPGDIKSLNHLARDDWRRDTGEEPLDGCGRWVGAEALMTLKGDVDNLGLIFQQGLNSPTFARMAALSRQMNAFFAVYLPWLCAGEYPNTYTVFAGGDDFFLIGPWHSTIRLAQRMKDEFHRYVAENTEIHFSAGLSMTKPGLPIRQLVTLVEEALADAKSYNPAQQVHALKNAVTCFGETASWTDLDRLMEREVALGSAAQDYALSTSYVYGLLRLTDMAGAIKERPENAIWHAYFAYRTRRLAETWYGDIEDKGEREAARTRLQARLALEIAREGIERHGSSYRIALFTYLYQQRD